MSKKMYSLIAGVATLGFIMLSAGCATRGGQVYLPDSTLSFHPGRENAMTEPMPLYINNCSYHLDSDENSPVAKCPTVMRFHNIKTDGVIYIMAFPVAYEVFLNDAALLQKLEEFFDGTLRQRGEPNREPNIVAKNIIMANLTWDFGSNGVIKERVVVFRVIKDAKEYTVFMVGQWPEQFDQEMVMIQDRIIFDVWSNSKKK